MVEIIKQNFHFQDPALLKKKTQQKEGGKKIRKVYIFPKTRFRGSSNIKMAAVFTSSCTELLHVLWRERSRGGTWELWASASSGHGHLSRREDSCFFHETSQDGLCGAEGVITWRRGSKSPQTVHLPLTHPLITDVWTSQNWKKRNQLSQAWLRETVIISSSCIVLLMLCDSYVALCRQ